MRERYISRSVSVACRAFGLLNLLNSLNHARSLNFCNRDGASGPVRVRKYVTNSRWCFFRQRRALSESDEDLRFGRDRIEPIRQFLLLCTMVNWTLVEHLLLDVPR
jgi:hypothetical protein